MSTAEFPGVRWHGQWAGLSLAILVPDAGTMIFATVTGVITVFNHHGSPHRTLTSQGSKEQTCPTRMETSTARSRL